MSKAQKATRWIRKAQSELRGADLSVDETTGLILVVRQLMEHVRTAGHAASMQLQEQERAEKKKAAQEAFDAHNKKRHLKVVAEEPDAPKEAAT